jgi:hypothetical protein
MNKKIFTLSLVLVSVLAGIYFRFYTVLLPYLDIVATRDVYKDESLAIRKGIQEKYPDISAVAQNKMGEQLFKDLLKTSRKELTQKISRRSHELKDRYRDEEGRVYLNGIDSYYWLRLLQNLLTKGHIGDRVVGGNEYDDLIGGVIDPATKKNVHLWLGVAFYRGASFFDKDIPLEGALFYIPIFLSTLIAIFSFCVAKKLGANDLGAFFASIFTNLSPFLMSRSVGEWFDTDIYNVLFPLFVFGIFVYAFAAKGLLRRVIFAGLAGLFLAFYASTWKGWWFIFDIILLSCLLFLLNQKLSQAEEKTDTGLIKSQALTFGIFVALASFFVIVLNDVSIWKDFIAEPLRLSSILKATQPSLWPNVYLTVAELASAKPIDVMNALGGYFVFFSGMIALLYILLKEHGLRDNRYGFGFLCLALWVASIFYAATEALRFALLLVVPMGLMCGIAVSKCYEVLGDAFSKHLKKSHGKIARAALVFIFSLYLVFDLWLVHTQTLGSIPQMDVYWHRALTEIKKETPQEAIINSWWDFGHWFKTIAERRVLFDGMTQDTPYAYWIASGLLSDNEKEFVGILKMINVNDNKAADDLENIEKIPAALAVRMIKKAVVMTKQEARLYLEQQVSPGKAEMLLAYLFPKVSPPVYFIVSSDMLAKIGAISYIGNWNFIKADLWLKKNRFSMVDFLTYAMKKYGLTRKEAETLYLEVSFLNKEESKPWFSKVVGYFSALTGSRQDGQLLFFENGLVVNLADNHAYVLSELPEKRGTPKSLIFMQNGLLKETAQKGADLPFSALLIKEKEGYKSLLLDTGLAKSMLVRLYYFKGEGLKDFKLWHEEVDEKGDAIYVYRLLWPEESKPKNTK